MRSTVLLLTLLAAKSAVFQPNIFRKLSSSSANNLAK
jgi:hypothetical protein